MQNSPNSRDITSMLFASAATLLLSLFSPLPSLQPAEAATERAPRAIDNLLDADWAAQEGAWWLESEGVEVELSFAPKHERLVWRVSGDETSVLLDAKTGEALSFEY